MYDIIEDLNSSELVYSTEAIKLDILTNSFKSLSVTNASDTIGLTLGLEESDLSSLGAENIVVNLLVNLWKGIVKVISKIITAFKKIVEQLYKLLTKLFKQGKSASQRLRDEFNKAKKGFEDNLENDISIADEYNIVESNYILFNFKKNISYQSIIELLDIKHKLIERVDTNPLIELIEELEVSLKSMKDIKSKSDLEDIDTLYNKTYYNKTNEFINKNSNSDVDNILNYENDKRHFIYLIDDTSISYIIVPDNYTDKIDYDALTPTVNINDRSIYADLVPMGESEIEAVINKLNLVEKDIMDALKDLKVKLTSLDKFIAIKNKELSKRLEELENINIDDKDLENSLITLGRQLINSCNTNTFTLLNKTIKGKIDTIKDIRNPDFMNYCVWSMYK